MARRVRKEEIIENVDRISPPIVIIDRPIHIPGTAMVVADNRKGAMIGGKWPQEKVIIPIDDILCDE